MMIAGAMAKRGVSRGHKRRRFCSSGLGAARVSLQECDRGGHVWGHTALNTGTNPTLLVLCGQGTTMNHHRIRHDRPREARSEQR